MTDNGAGDEDSTIGEVCVSGLTPGDYTSTRPRRRRAMAVPLGPTRRRPWLSGPNCTDNQPSDANSAVFTNAPLADIQVNFRDGGSGETSATSITCDNAATPPDTTPATGWDDSVTHEDIPIDPSPRTIVCTIEIDP